MFAQNSQEHDEGIFFGQDTGNVVGEPPPASSSNLNLNSHTIRPGRNKCIILVAYDNHV